MKTSPAGIALIKQFESCRLDAYRDARGTPTVGYGHTGPGVMIGQTITQARADELLAADLERTEAWVASQVRVPLTQPQFDALTSFTYNLGPRVLLLSTLLQKLNAGDYAGASAEFPRWTHAGAEVLDGLVKRRAAERSLFDQQA